MPPKVKFSKEEIVNAAVALTREQGFEAVTARNVGARLGTSSKPVYVAFDDMGQLKREVLRHAMMLSQGYCQREMERGQYPAYKATGMAYVRFAKEESNLFRLLYMRDRSNEEEDLAADGNFNTVVKLVENQTGLDVAAANLFHGEMWSFVHGIATMFATSYLDWNFELVDRMLTDVYEGLRLRYAQEGVL